ncbi:LysR family transcriptional regulator [Niveibacterium sp. SC-1]|uniref:LysR family transcriptional regulator n=1 Tax=Niveibacterium sp. SC-1 TaxID=3135646 RepID=UPI00311E1035
MNLARLDLQLLRVFEALMSEGNASRAAMRLHLSQPAVSHALNRLREAFGDRLFVPHARGMTPTPRARELAGAVQATLDCARRLAAAVSDFDPRRAEREFVIGMSEIAAHLLLPVLHAHLRREAPGLRLRVLPVSYWTASELLQKGEVELLLGVLPEAAPGQRGADLLAEPLGCLRHPGWSRAPGLAEYLGSEHLQVAPGGETESYVDCHLAQSGHARRIGLTIAHQALVPELVAGSKLVVSGPWRLLERHARTLGVPVQPLPLNIAPMQLGLRWPGSADGDRGLAWLRERIAEIALPMQFPAERVAA